MKDINASILGKVIQERKNQTHKGDYGRVLLIGGCYPYGGAIIMAARAAVAAGAGLVTAATETPTIQALHTQLPEAMAIDLEDRERLSHLVSKMDCIVMGPGMEFQDRTSQILSGLLGQLRPDQRLVLDGGAIETFAKLGRQTQAQVIFTPHQGEFERLTGLLVEEQTPERNQEAVDRFPQGTISLVKKHGTEVYVAGASVEDVLCLPIGGPYQATGGMGDTLAGMVGAFLAQFKDVSAVDRLSAALYLHSLIASDLAEDLYVVRPTAISQVLPAYMKRYQGGRGLS